MDTNTLDYCKRLRTLCETIQDKMSYEIFYATCKRFVDFKQSKICTKNISKKELIERLIAKGLMEYRLNKETGIKDKFPDDRTVRRAMRELLSKGFPIITTSHEDGCFIVEKTNEIDLPQKENKKRAVSILAVDKGYDLVRQFISGQQNFLS